ncbi:MAG: 50S ribosomal subunit L30 [Lasallia pustulata]|uniref:Large ribosomal subunit protein mL46 n=1 Tax=Lasallia pustulata TaxID=136370 RepID=A0A1W5D0S7_9LECA|nr:MAG: 50S ribosomal subunit L30 [Lasallia pustulata]SLM36625.1 Ribosomal protein L46 [Lasallia pustulata]
MSTAHNGARRLVSQWRPSTSDQSICKSCLATLHRRRYAFVAAAATRIEEPAAPVHHTPPVTASTSPRPSYQINASLVLSRPPVITRDLTPFEKAYFFYQRRLNERLALPFGRYFYYGKGTFGDIEWKRKIKERQTPARDIGVYNAYSKEGWNDELLVGAKESEPEHQLEALLKDAEDVMTEGDDAADVKKEPVEKPMPRVTEADKTGDVKSLNRALQRTLYLLVKGGKGGWTFPTTGLVPKEDLHTAAERIIVQAGGLNMNTWVVGNLPVGHQSIDYPKTIVDEEKKIEQLGEKTFFMKARIMGGQANLKDNKFGLEDFKWLAKDEIQKEVHPRYWSAVRNMLVER